MNGTQTWGKKRTLFETLMDIIGIGRKRREAERKAQQKAKARNARKSAARKAQKIAESQARENVVNWLADLGRYYLHMADADHDNKTYWLSRSSAATQHAVAVQEMKRIEFLELYAWLKDADEYARNNNVSLEELLESMAA